ncbi:spore gernimation protein [Paenibacillus sp. P3E]|uniref:GerAB/ArcD/ProY family transporter n=1 Tax=unclassified Paenibacillus TaxID=185978 RepID=UPI00093ABE3D|nr:MULTISPECIES: GerAB/ArcD/ProY family transporter [unclassified Paenibacillus]OKP77505.1 spore gernimation protein [Paenibacillus sp. P3E]OKP92226.1 spore gernimation protein [Paenibacillus sp. P32E]
MSQRNSIRLSELAICISLFEVGSTTLFFIGGEAKQDAWLAMLVGALAGLFVLLMHLSIHHQEPLLDLFLLFRRYMGKYLGTFINLLFVGYFSYEASRNLRDFGEITVMTLLNQTSLWIIMLIVILVVSNSIRYGYRVMFLMCVIFFPIVLVSYALISILIPVTGLFHFEFMFPVLESGWKPVLNAALPEIVSFPFGQTVLFLVFYPYARTGKGLNRAVIISYVLTALSLTFINQLNIFVLGPKIALYSTLPLLETVQLIDLAEVFERLDALFTLLLFLGLGVKMGAFFNGAVIGLEKITGISYKKWVAPVAILTFGLAFLSPNYTHHIVTGRRIVLNYVFPVFQILLPLLLLIIILIRKRTKQD